MRIITIFLSRVGDYFVSLSETTRKQIVILGLLLMGGWGVYKLVMSIQRLNDPLPPASTDQLIEPMKDLFGPARQTYGNYQQTRQRIDSLKLNSN